MSNLVSTKDFFSKPQVMDKFKELLGEKATGFVSSVLQVVNSNGYLQNADPKTVYTSAMMAASLNLPINQNLGFAYIVPYNTSFKDETGQWRKKQVAQFQMGYRGFIQLAQRTGQYRSINAIPINEGYFVSWNPLTEELIVDFTKEPSEKIVGYAAFFELNNGFRKYVYWTKDQVIKHAKQYSKAFDSEKGDKSPWNTHFDEMACKTVLKMALSKYGILSIEMQRANIADQAIIKEYDHNTEEIEVEYVDNEQPEQIETKSTLKSIANAKKSIEKGISTFEDIANAYELTEEQQQELKQVKKIEGVK